MQCGSSLFSQVGHHLLIPSASLSPCQLLKGQLQQEGFCVHRRGLSVSACDFSELTLQEHGHTIFLKGLHCSCEPSCKCQLLLLLRESHTPLLLACELCLCAGLQGCCLVLQLSCPLPWEVELPGGTQSASDPISLD